MAVTRDRASTRFLKDVLRALRTLSFCFPERGRAGAAVCLLHPLAGATHSPWARPLQRATEPRAGGAWFSGLQTAA